MTNETRKYRKELSFWHVVFLATGAILGPAIAFTPVSVLALAGPVGLLAWPISFLFIIPIALVYVELGTMWPKAGGVAYYPSKSSGALVGALNGWGAFIGYSLAVGSIMVAFIQYLSYYLPSLFANGTLTPLGIFATAVSVLAVFFVNSLRIKRWGDINNWLTIFTIILIMIFVVALLTYYNPANLTSFGGLMPLGTGGLFLAVAATVYGWGGFRQPIDYAEEIHDPGKSIPKAIYVTLLIVLVVYTLESLAFLGAFNWAYLGITAGNWGGLSSLAYPYVSASLGVGLPIIVVVSLVAALIASFKDGMIYQGGAARVGHTLARYDKIFPNFFTRMSGKGIPIVSSLVVFVIVLIYVALLPSFSSLFPLVVDGLLISYSPGVVSLAVFRSKYPDQARPYKLPAYKVLSPLTFVLATLLIFWSGWAAVEIFLGTVLVGIVFLAFYHKNRRLTGDDVVKGLWFPIYLLITMVLSYASSSTFGGQGWIAFPYDTILFAIVSLVFFYIGYYSGLSYKGDATVDESVGPAPA